MAITNMDIFDQVRRKLDYEDTDIYDLDIQENITSAMFKLMAEGVPAPEDLTSDYLDMYINCVVMAVSLYMFTDIDVESVQPRYHNNVTTLRLELETRKMLGVM